VAINSALFITFEFAYKIKTYWKKKVVQKDLIWMILTC